MRNLKQSTAANVMVFMTDSSDHVTGKTGLTLTITTSKDGAAFASISPTVTERGSGWYSLALTTSHTDTLGDLAIHATGTGADPTDFCCRVIAVDLADATRFGLSALPNAAANANGGLPVLSVSGTTLGYTISTLTTYTGNTPQTGDSYARIGANGASLTALASASNLAIVAGYIDTEVAAILAAVDTEVASILSTVTALSTTVGVAGLGLSAIPKAGYKLASDGLDSIAVTAPAGVATTFPGMVVQTWRRFFKKAVKNGTQILTYADDLTTVSTTQAISDDGTTQTQGAAT